MAATYARPREVSDDEPPPLSAPTQELEEDSLHDDFRIGSLSAKDRERLKTRKQIRVLTQAIDEDRASGVLTTESLKDAVEKANVIYTESVIRSTVKEAREAVLDSNFLRSAAESVRQLALNLQTGMRVYYPEEYIKKVAAVLNVTDEVADWDAFYVGDCFASVPMATFLYGPLSVEKKKIARRQGQRRQAPEGEAARPTQVSEEMLEAEKSEETTKRIDAAFMALRHNDGVDVWRFVLDPQSFTRTVENLFHLSFLVKEGRAKLVDSGSTITLTLGVPPKEGAVVKNFQAIAALDYATWQLLCRYYSDQKEPMIEPIDHVDPRALQRQSQTQSTSRKRHRTQEQGENDVEEQSASQAEGGRVKIKAEPKRKRRRSDDESD